MAETENYEQDYKKWLVFSDLIKDPSSIKELEKVLKKKKSSKKISISKKTEDNKNWFFLTEVGKATSLKINRDNIGYMIEYLSQNYKPTKSTKSDNPFSNSKNYNKKSIDQDSSNTKLYSRNKIFHGIIHSFITFLFLQLTIIPTVALDLQFGIFFQLLRFLIVLAGTYYCFKTYKNNYDQFLNFSDVYLIVWNFYAFSFFFYLTELTLLSVPEYIPNIAWSSSIYLGTLIVGLLLNLLTSFIPAAILNFLKNSI